MHSNISKLLLLSCLVLFTTLGWSLVADYTFTSTVGTYGEVTGGTVHGTSANNDQVFNAIPIGFDFEFVDSSHIFSTVSISSNGYIALGSTVLSSNTPLSSGTSNYIAAAMSRDLISRADGSLMSNLTGIEPNRVFTIQWHNYRRNSAQAAADTLNFQIQLYESSNEVKFVYGYTKAANASIVATVQCGLRGTSSADFFNRTTTTSWTATTIGVSNSATCTMNNTIVPPNGLIFSWTSGTRPQPAQIKSPLNSATDVDTLASLEWYSGGGGPTGFKVYFGTDNPPSNLVNGIVTTSLFYNPDPDLHYLTTYYWKIIPFNGMGDAENCPIWSFTAMHNPLVTQFPYHQNWDNAVAPIILPYWRVVNANNDFNASNVPYTWVAVNTGAFSAPNALRCIYNSSVAIPMDDWLISPPLQLTAGTYYKVEFKYKAHNVAFPEKLEIKFGTSQTPTGLTTQIFNNTSITNTGFVTGEAFFPLLPTNGVYYFGFHGYSNANMYALYLDDITISEIIPVFNPPRNLAASTGDGSIHLNWDPPLTRRLDGYLVYRDNALITPNPITERTYIDNQVTVETLYTYNVVAAYISPTGVSDPDSCEVSKTPDFSPPDSLSYVAGLHFVNLSWHAPDGVFPAGYLVYRNEVLLTPIPLTTLVYSDTTGVPGLFYPYYVTAVYTTPEGESLPSNTVFAAKLVDAIPPSDLRAMVSSPNVNLTWIAPVSLNLTGYNVYRDSVLIQTVDAGTIAYVDYNLFAGTYSYQVSALYTVGESPRIGPALAVVGPVFNPPRNLTAIGELTGIRVRWSPPSPMLGNLTGYRLFRDGSLYNPAILTDTTFFDPAIISGRVYSYFVRAFYNNPSGTSAPSNSDSDSGGETLNPPYNLQYTVAQDNVSLTWLPPGGPILQNWIKFDDSVNFNGFGNNGVINFDIAARFTQTELSGISDRYLTKVRFFPRETNCIYTVKIYTGGTSLTIPGNLVDTVRVINPVIGAWNTVDLHSPIPIPTTGELRIAINCNSQAGYPAGCDDGPSNPYKGNVMFYNNAWIILTDINTDYDYNWNIQGFVVNFIGREEPLLLSNSIIPESNTRYSYVDPGTITVDPSNRRVHTEAVRNDSRSLSGYKVYRNGVVVKTINDYIDSYFVDIEVPNGTYEYKVTATYTTGESEPCDSVIVPVNYNQPPVIYYEGFETYDNFALTFGDWILADVDNSPTLGIQNVTFPNSGGHMSYMVFNPSATTPPVTNLTARSGQKMAACFDAITPPNNDWMITPRIRLGTTNKVTFWVKSLMAQNGLERFKLGLSMSSNPQPSSFTIFLTGVDYETAPLEWTKRTFDIPAQYNNMNISLGFKCESDSASAFFVDDITVRSYVDNEDEVTPVSSTILRGNYPNPFNPETSISYTIKNDEQVKIEIFNLKGEKIKTLVNTKQKSGNYKAKWLGEDQNGKKVSSGIYFYKMTSGNYSSTKKMILMK